MRFGGRRESDNVESQTGGLGGFGGGGGGGGAALLLGLVFSRFGIGRVVVVLGLMFFLGGNPLGLTGGEDQAGHAHGRRRRAWIASLFGRPGAAFHLPGPRSDRGSLD